MAAGRGPGDVWWSEELGENLHQIYKLEKAIKREEDKLETDAKKMNDMIASAMAEMAEHDAKFRRSRALRQPMQEGNLDAAFEDMLRDGMPSSASPTEPPRPVVTPVNINVSQTAPLDSAAASAASTTRAQNSSRQNSSRATPSSLSSTPSEDRLTSSRNSTAPNAASGSFSASDDPLLTASLSTASRFEIVNDDPLLTASLSTASRFEIINDDPLLSASLLPAPRA